MVVNVEIQNMPSKPIKGHGWLVARQDITVGHPQLWYYGFYREKLRADTAAYEIRNGVVMEVMDND